MANRKKKEIGILVLLIVAVLVMTVGFALYSQTLTITGNVTVKGGPWNVHYDTSSLATTAGSVTATNPTLTNTDFSFTVTLSKPGDFYEATFNAVNEGTMDALLKSITLSPTLTTAEAKYFSYSVTYNNGTPYTATTTGITGVTLAANGSHPVKVRVEYLEPALSSDLPAGDQTFTISGSLLYESE